MVTVFFHRSFTRVVASERQLDIVVETYQQVFEVAGAAGEVSRGVSPVVNPVTPGGCRHLLQLMPATARRYGVFNRRDPTANLSGGTRYLRDLLIRFDNDIELALAGYNAGENTVVRYGNQIPPFDETQEYVRKVLMLYSTNQGDN